MSTFSAITQEELKELSKFFGIKEDDIFSSIEQTETKDFKRLKITTFDGRIYRCNKLNGKYIKF